MTGQPSRRHTIAAGLAGLAAVGGVGACTRALGDSDADKAANPALEMCLPGPEHTGREFRGPRQAGIIEDPQSHGAFVALDLATTATRDTLRRILKVWTDDIERLMSGRPSLTDQEPELAASPANLTVTVGVGPRTVAVAGATAPAWLAPLPAFPSIDRLEPRWSGGDLLLQITADSPTTVHHAQRRLVSGTGDLAAVRWVQRGFRDPFETAKRPMRNLFGQVDGTVQPRTDGPDDARLWVGADGPEWLRDGSALVLRRIRMNLDTWDEADRGTRENAVGRRLPDGSPLTAKAGSGPDVPSDLSATNSLGFPTIHEGAHIRRAAATAAHEVFLRRPYSYDDSVGSTSDAGLLFAAYCADPVRQFVPVQQRIADGDLLNTWITPVGSAVFAILPGARDGEILGQALVT